MTATTPQKNVPNFRDSIQVTIANSASLSEAGKFYGNTLIGILMPAAWTSASLSFQGSIDGTNFYDLYDSTGTEKTCTAGASRILLFPPQDWFGVEWIKVRSGTSAAAVNQGADRVITLLLGY
jgi:hypothetical protein